MPFLQNRKEELPDSSLAFLGSEKFESDQNQKADSRELVKYFWIRAPKVIVYNQNFSDGAKLLYLILLDYQGRNSYAFPSLETLARDTGKTVRRVQQLLKELEIGGAIEIVAQPGWVNLYRVGLPPSESAANPTPVNTNGVCKDGSDGKVNGNISIELLEVSEVSDEANEKISSEAEPKSITPLKDFASIPMQNSSSESDSVKLKNSVCKKSHVASTRTVLAKSNNVARSNRNPNRSRSVSMAKIQMFSHDQCNTNLTDDQAAIAKILSDAGVATPDAEKIALTNPKLLDVQQWVELAKTKTNPGGYLAVVLGKLNAAPPPITQGKTASSDNPTSSQRLSEIPYQANWQQRHNRTRHQEAGVLAYVRKHQAELQKWQSQSQQTSNTFPEANAIENLDIAPFDTTNTTAKEQVEESSYALSVASSNNMLENNLVLTDCSAVSPTVDDSSENRELANDPKMRLMLRQLDKLALQYLKQVRLCDTKLVISFIGNYLPSQNVTSWVPTIRANYPSVSGIVVL